jgi:tetratricopeptide (TPR) repeat protein
MPTDTLQPALYLFNLSDQSVKSIQLTIILLDSYAQPLKQHTERITVRHALGRSSFTAAMPLEPALETAAAEVIFEKVWFDDNSVWRRSDNPLIEYKVDVVPHGQELEMLKILAGDDACCYPQNERRLWICICGRPNGITETVCRRCGRAHGEVLRNFNQQTVEAITKQRVTELEDMALSARKSASSRQEEREKQLLIKQKRKRVVIHAMITVIVLITAGFCYVRYLAPFIQYYDARELFRSGQYSDAREALIQMPDYLDANELVSECDYLTAGLRLAEGTEEALIEAEELYAGLGDYRDARYLALQALYLRADLHVIHEDYENAAGLYDQLEGYRDAYMLAQNARMQHAKRMMAAKEYAAAKTVFLLLGDYQDAQSLALECDYLPAVAALTLKNYDTAIPLFASLGEYRQANEMLLTAYYLKAESLYAQGYYEQAGEAYLLAGHYEDAQDKAVQSMYQHIDALMLNQAYETAYHLLLNLSGDEDSSVRMHECTYQLGVAAEIAGHPHEAESYYSLIPDYRDSRERLDGILYERALALLETGSLDSAGLLFERLADYRDSAAMVLEVDYGKAMKYITEGKYDDGITLLDCLGEYKDAGELMKTAINEYVQALITECDYEKALEYLGKLDEQNPASEWAAVCRYALAEDAMGTGDFIAAAKQYIQCGEYADAVIKAESAYAAYYGGVTEDVLSAFADEAYGRVISLLSDIELDQMPDIYHEALDCYNESHYRIANDLYNQGFPYQALPYYRKIVGYKDVESAKLSRNAYQILGVWQDENRLSMRFNDDGTCLIDGNPLYYTVRNYYVSTGETADELNAVYRISRLTANELTLRDLRDGINNTYWMTRVR